MPNYTIPYAPNQSYVPNGRLVDLIRAQGQDAARSAEIRGQNSANLWNTVGQSIQQGVGAVTQAVQDSHVQKQNDQIRKLQVENLEQPKKDEAALTTAFGLPTRAATLKSLEASPDLYKKAVNHYQTIDSNMKQLLGSVAAGVREFGDSSDAALAGFGDLIEQGFDPQKINRYRMMVIEHPEHVGDLVDKLLTESPDESHRALVRKAPKAPSYSTRNPEYDVIDDATGQVVTPGTPKPVEPPKPANVGSFEDYVTRKYGAQPTPDQIESARKAYGDAGRVSVSVGGPEGGLNPDAVEYTATQYRILGPGGIPTRIEGPDRVKILNEAAKQAKQLGQSPAVAVQRQAAYKADAGALNQMRKMSSSAESFENKALAQADLVRDLSQKVDRTKFPLLNSAILSGKTELLGDTNAQQLYNAITTFTSEYAKIMEGSTGSAAGSSDSARKAAARLIAAKMNKGTVNDVLDLMQKEMRYTINGYGATINHITERMGGTPPAQPTEAPKQIRYDMQGNVIKQ